MSELSSHTQEPTVAELAAEVAKLRERVEDLEDARELDAAVLRNAGKSLVPFDAIRNELGLDS